MSKPSISKPTIDNSAILAFAEGDTEPMNNKPTVTAKKGKKIPKSGLVPDGDVRLTANISGKLHLKLKIKAAEQRTTIGELIEELIENNI